MANNQIVNFNRQDVANAYRRNQYAQALQERMNAPIPVNTYQGFQAPTSPAAGIAKALDIYSVWQNEKNQEKQYQDEKAASEQKAQNIINTQNEKATEFRNKFNPDVTEQMIGGNTSFTPTQYADALNAYGKPQEPTQASDMLNGEPTTYGRNEGTLQTTSTPRTREEIMRLESEGFGSDNLGMNRIAQNSRESRVADETAKAVIDKALVDRGYVTGDYSKTLADKIEADTTKNTREVDAATTKFGRDKILKEMDNTQKLDKSQKEAQAKIDAAELKYNNLTPQVKLKVIEGKDAIEASSQAMKIMDEALELNKKPTYEGYLANPRAVLRNNIPLFPKSTEASNTIDLDNAVMTNAASSFKLIFGGQPSNKEDQFLVDLQGYSKRTPGDRVKILNRGRDLANDRLNYNTKKVNSLLSGEYFKPTNVDTPNNTKIDQLNDPLGLRQ